MAVMGVVREPPDLFAGLAGDPRASNPPAVRACRLLALAVGSTSRSSKSKLRCAASAFATPFSPHRPIAPDQRELGTLQPWQTARRT